MPLPIPRKFTPASASRLQRPVLPSQKFTPAPAPSPKRPVPAKTMFEKEEYVSIKKLMREARKSPVVIPGTGGQKWTRKQFEDILKQRLSYQRVGTHLKKQEAKRILRQMRKEDKGRPSRERRTLEERWSLKGKY